MDARRSFTGHARRRQTSRLVRVGEVLSRFFITIGGIGTIIAVGMVCVFLVWVVHPLFLGAAVKEVESFPVSGNAAQPVRTAVDEYQMLGWTLFSDGTLEVFRF